jgi:tetratricopeptide (TPR) repeat protein
VADEKGPKDALPFPTRRKVTRADVTAFAGKLARERAEAVSIVARLLRETPRNDIPALAERPELQTLGVLDRLAVLVSLQLTREPQYALTLAGLAVSLSDRLPVDAYAIVSRAQARALARKELGKTLSFLGRHEESVEAFEKAQAELEEHGTLGHDRAIIRLNLAITYLDMARYAEARPLLVECKEVFRGHGDTKLYVLSGFYEGVLLQRMHLYRQARETYLLLIVSNMDIPSDTLAALHQTIGLCSIELGDFESAEENLTRAVQLHKANRKPLEAVRAELGRGRILIRKGLPGVGIQHLRVVRHQFLRHSLAEEAGICGLDMVEGMLQLGQNEQAELLSRTILNEFLAASLNTRAITALGYLTEAIAAHKATPKHAATVREYVLSLRTEPERELPRLHLLTDGRGVVMASPRLFTAFFTTRTILAIGSSPFSRANAPDGAAEAPTTAKKHTATTAITERRIQLLLIRHSAG